MLSNIDVQILKELDRHNTKAYVIAVVMNKLDNENKKNKFFEYLSMNRGVILDKVDIIENLKCILKEGKM